MRTGWTIGRGKGLSLAALVAAIAAALGLLTTTAAGQANNAKPAATEVGVTGTAIHIAVIADVDNPGGYQNLFLGARNAVQGFAKYVNASCATRDKCLAGRQLVVDFYDSHLNSNETRNAEISACANDFAMVGTTAGNLTSVDEMLNCKDKAGATTGIPDIPVLAPPLVQQCSNESFPIVPPVVHCSSRAKHPQTFEANVARGYYFTKKYGTLHGIYIFSGLSTIGFADQFASGFGALRALGIRSDGDYRPVAVTLQSQLTTMVQAMKDKNSNYGMCALQYSCTVLLRREAILQGIANQVKVWDCLIQCYDKGFLRNGGTDVEHEYVDTNFLPFYDLKEQKANRMLANFVRYTGTDKVDPFGDEAWAAAVAFRDAVNATVKSHGPNGLTRANLLAALDNIHKFNADGMLAPFDLAGRKNSECHVLTQVRNGTFVRVQPTKPGIFDCNSKYLITRKLDLLNGP